MQYKKMAEKGNQNFNTTELFNATAGGFVSGFVSTGISSIPIGNPTDANGSIMLSNLFGGVSGSMTSHTGQAIREKLNETHTTFGN